MIDADPLQGLQQKEANRKTSVSLCYHLTVHSAVLSAPQWVLCEVVDPPRPPRVSHSCVRAHVDGKPAE